MVLVGKTDAQDYAFKVLVTKGKNEVKSGDGWQTVKVGASLRSQDKIKVTQNAYVGLVHSSGKPLELKQAGEYKVSELSDRVKNSGASVMTKYTDFILSSNTEKKNNLAATGAVHRGLPKVEVYIPAFPKGQVVYNDDVIITWDNKFAGPYIVKFTNIFDDELDKAETADAFFKLNLADIKFVKEDNITVKVYPKADPTKISDGFTLRRIAKAEKEHITKSLKEIATPTQEPTALNKYILAGFYEENGLLIDAATSYHEAIKMAPDVTAYQEEFNAFLIRYGMKEDPQKK
jgi:hypothetical protein